MNPPARYMDGWGIRCRPRNRGSFQFIVTTARPFCFDTRKAARMAARSYRSLGLAADAVRIRVTIESQEG